MFDEINNTNEFQKRKFCDGERYLFLGENYQLHIRKVSIQDGASIREAANEEHLWILQTPVLEARAVREIMVQWYRYQAKKVIDERISIYQTFIAQPIGTVRIKEQKTRWGSCSSKHNLNFNWKCIMAPLKMIDYIVVHELCHLKELNHSKRFWNEIEKILPDYEERAQWWKVHGRELELDYVM